MKAYSFFEDVVTIVDYVPLLFPSVDSAVDLFDTIAEVNDFILKNYLHTSKIIDTRFHTSKLLRQLFRILDVVYWHHLQLFFAPHQVVQLGFQIHIDGLKLEESFVDIAEGLVVCTDLVVHGLELSRIR